MKEKADKRHRYGRHYTPESVAKLLAAFAVRSSRDVVLDPSCGDGRLLEAALRVKRALAVGPSRRPEGPRGVDLVQPRISFPEPGPGPEDLFGIDLSRGSIRLARRRLGARIARADFFDVDPGSRLGDGMALPLEFDAIIGNPPYIRQEVMGASDKQRIARRLLRKATPGSIPADGPFAPAGNSGVANMEGLDWSGWSGRSDIYVYFFVYAARFLSPRGRLVFLTSSSWLDVGYGAALKDFLLRNFRIIAVVESVAESFFEDASINTTITVLERELDPSSRHENPVRFVQLLTPVQDLMVGTGIAPEEDQYAGDLGWFSNLAQAIEHGKPDSFPGGMRVRRVSQRTLLEGLAYRPTPGNPGKRGVAARDAAMESVSMNRTQRIGSNWGKYLRAADVFFEIIDRGRERLQPLSELASVRFGVKTGANKFFYLKEHLTDRSEEKRAGQTPSGSDSRKANLIRLDEMASIRRGLTTGANGFFYVKPVVDGDRGNGGRAKSSRSRVAASRRTGDYTDVVDGSGGRHKIESIYLSPVIFSLKEIPGIIISPGQTKRLFFNCPASEQDLAGSAALTYIKAGERSGYHKRPSCSSRSQWYTVAPDRKPAPIIFPSKVGERWVVSLNRAGVLEDKKLYGIYPRPAVPAEQLAAVLNSTWVRYCAEVTCRQMTGAQAIADIDVVVAEQILLPDTKQLPPAQQRQLVDAFRCLAGRPVLSIFAEKDREDRRRLDMLVLAAIGFVDESERGRVLEELYAAVMELVSSRLSKSGRGVGAAPPA
jgi:hypothetical protein